MTLEEYFRKNSDKTPDHIVRCSVIGDDVTFYIHPHGHDGDTEDFLVKGNNLSPDPKITKNN